MYERGIVRKVEGEVAQVLISPLKPEACGTCGTCREAPEGRLLEVRGLPGLAPGARVEIEVPDDETLGPALVVFLLPVLAILVGAAAGTRLPEWTGWKGLSPLVGGVLGTALLLIPSLVVIRAYDRSYRRKAPKARIRRILE